MTRKPGKSPTGSAEAVAVRRRRSSVSTGDSGTGRRKATGRAADWKDPEDAPEVTDAMLDRATYREGDKVIRPRGRPPLGDQPKTQVTLRLDSDVVSTYRATGEGWQSRINADLRRSADRWRKA